MDSQSANKTVIDTIKKKAKHLKPKGKRGVVAVKRLGRNYKTGNFDKITAAAGAKYGSSKAGKRVAGAIYWAKARGK